MVGDYSTPTERWRRRGDIMSASYQGETERGRENQKEEAEEEEEKEKEEKPAVDVCRFYIYQEGAGGAGNRPLSPFRKGLSQICSGYWKTDSPC